MADVKKQCAGCFHWRTHNGLVPSGKQFAFCHYCLDNEKCRKEVDGVCESFSARRSHGKQKCVPAEAGA